MAISLLSSARLVNRLGLAAVAIVFLALPAKADDQITKKDGNVISGQIVGVSNGQVFYNIKNASGGTVKLSVYLTDVQSVTMDAPPEVAKVANAEPAAVITALDPIVKQYAGLPADWVVSSMARLAEAYNAQGKAPQAVAVYDQIDTLYPNSKYHTEVVAGKAGMVLQQGKVDEALADVQPIVDKANQDIAPSPSDGALYANAFLVYGQALQAQKKYAQALEAYLTVKTMYYQNPALADQASQLAQKLREQNPGLGVP